MASTLPPLTRSRTGDQNVKTTEPVSPGAPGVTVRKAPFPITLVLPRFVLSAQRNILIPVNPSSRRTVLAAVTLTILSVYVPDLIHVTELTPGPTHFETNI
ncbi:hypothetical protein QFC22_004638 [Naganishia vaughanmartiniae]|uniref:Uncharacterized protein n=1 Tax=Naganishia vaughanmartiniae TaxID=1424756 RepID=A0ACC2WYW7_9TREE|nr:hypothetical protein QFC22_004638 [Naganishia vaughanmartiniae]